MSSSVLASSATSSLASGSGRGGSGRACGRSPARSRQLADRRHRAARDHQAGEPRAPLPAGAEDQEEAHACRAYSSSIPEPARVGRDRAPFRFGGLERASRRETPLCSRGNEPSRREHRLKSVILRRPPRRFRPPVAPSSTQVLASSPLGGAPSRRGPQLAARPSPARSRGIAPLCNIDSSHAPSPRSGRRIRHRRQQPEVDREPAQVANVGTAEPSARRQRDPQPPRPVEPAKHTGRPPRRGGCGGAAARRRPRAFVGGSTRTPRSCSSSRRGRSPRPRRAAAGAGRGPLVAHQVLGQLELALGQLDGRSPRRTSWVSGLSCRSPTTSTPPRGGRRRNSARSRASSSWRSNG